MQSPNDPTAPELVWPECTDREAPVPGVVRVWSATLVDETALRANVNRLLSEPEVRRAAGFKTGQLQRRFILSRMVLRRLLANSLGVPPLSLRFETVANGKPVLAGHPEVQFNLAHSGDLMLLAVTKGCPVGVDVELIRRPRDPLEVANRFFSPREAEWLQSIAPEEVPAAFFRLWTRKEAVLKATGGGLSGGLNSIELLESDGSLKATVTQEDTGSCWAVVALTPARQFVGALAFPASRAGMEIQTFQMR